MKAQKSLFNRDLDSRVNSAKVADLTAHHLTQMWIVISPMEAQALQAGVVSSSILQQIQQLLAPGPLRGAE